MDPVRNLRGFGNTKPIPVIHTIPPLFSAVWKIEVVTDTETIDVTELLVDGYFFDGVTSTIGDFEFKILDPNNTNSNKIEEYDTVNVYIDYGTIASTLRFSGKIEKLSNQQQIYLTLTGRSLGIITAGTNVTYSSSGLKARSVIITEIINQYFSGVISTSGIEEDLFEIDVNYEDIPFWTVVEEICISGGRDSYINSSSVLNYFIKGSRENPTEAVVEDNNLIETVDYAKDTEEIYTKVRVYGKRISGIPIISSSTEDTTYTKGIVKVLKIDNSSIDNSIQAAELATAEASDKRLPPTIGSILSTMLPTIQPGENIYISNPTNNIPPAFYEINSYRHIFSESGSPSTELTIKKQKVALSTILKSNIKFQFEAPDNENKDDMDYSDITTYESVSGTFNNTEISNNQLVVSANETGGTWTSDTVTFSGNMSKFTFQISGTNLASAFTTFVSNIFYSLDGGSLFTQWDGNVVENPGSNSLTFRIDLNQDSASVEAVAFLYSLD